MAKNDAYHEIGFWRPKINKYKRVGFNPKYWFYRLKWNTVHKIHRVTHFPIHIDLETSNYCNLRCVMCPHSMPDEGFDKGMMSFDLAKKIIDEGSKEGLYSLKLNMRGEPLLNKHLIDMVSYAKEKCVLEVMFNTNGLLLTEEKIRDLINAGIDLIIISIDGATKETYESIRVGGNYDLLEHNIRFLSDYRKKKRLRKPIIRLQFVKMKENIHELNMYIEKWKHYVDVLTANDYSMRVRQEDKSVKERKAIGRVCCPHPWRRVSVTWEGKALMCCVDWNIRSPVGDCNKESIKEIWHGERMTFVRNYLKRLEHVKVEACKNCFAPVSYRWK